MTESDDLWRRVGSLIRSTREQLDHWVEAVSRSPQVERLKIDAAFLAHERDRLLTRLGEQTARLLGSDFDLPSVVAGALHRIGGLFEKLGRPQPDPPGWTPSPYEPPRYDHPVEVAPFESPSGFDHGRYERDYQPPGHAGSGSEPTAADSVEVLPPRKKAASKAKAAKRPVTDKPLDTAPAKKPKAKAAKPKPAQATTKAGGKSAPAAGSKKAKAAAATVPSEKGSTPHKS